jgi:hypothetical protein
MPLTPNLFRFGLHQTADDLRWLPKYLRQCIGNALVAENVPLRDATHDR